MAPSVTKADRVLHGMSRGMPSMVALLGLLAVAGYQNRNKIAEMLGGVKQAPGRPGQPNTPEGKGSVLGKLGGLLGGVSAGHCAERRTGP